MGQRADAVDNRDLFDPSGESLTASQAAATSSSSPEVTELREQIEQTRAEMSETIGAIREELDPQALKEQVTAQVKEKARTQAQKGVTRAKEVVQGTAQQAREKAAEVAGMAQQGMRKAPAQLQQLRQQAPDYVATIRQQAPTYLARLQDWMQHEYRYRKVQLVDLRRTRPAAFYALCVGAAAVAAVVLFWPIQAARKEPEPPDQMQQTVETGRDVLRRVGRIAGAARRAAREQAQEEGLAA